MNLILCIVYVLSSSLALVLIKAGGGQTIVSLKLNTLGFMTNWQVVLGAVLYVMSFFIWMAILPRFKITFISPILYGSAYMAISVLSWFILKEKLSMNELIGFIFILAGIFICIFFKKY